MNSSSEVSIARCRRYHPDSLNDSLKLLFEPWGGISGIVNPGQKVLLKPNLLAAARPEEAVTTHPALILALTLAIQEAGGEVIIGDSPGSDDPEVVYRVTGMLSVAEQTGASLIRFDRARQKDYYGVKQRRFDLAEELDQADLIINVAKLKTHPLTGLTGAVKNVYGCIAGKKKARMHFEYPLPADFARLLIDVCRAVKPSFSILDAVIGMDGMGPRRGKPKSIGLLMASQNPFALDTAAAEVVGFKTEQVTTLKAARELSIIGANPAELKVKGLSIEECRIENFDPGVTGEGSIARLIARFPLAWISNLAGSRRPFPHINRKLCSSCGKCVEGCPAQIIVYKNSIPDIDIDACIRCYCCQEFCPGGAIDLKF
jgi:uncharacterized protein (DUF362 family)/Pyruvate/2-oxoacid:ferredoxin oxidoreductase delta subunit